MNSSNGLDVLGSLNRVFPLVITEDTYWPDIGFLLVLGVCWKIVAVVTIMIKARRFAPIRDEKMGQIQVMNTASPVPAPPAPAQEERESGDEFSC